MAWSSSVTYINYVHVVAIDITSPYTCCLSCPSIFSSVFSGQYRLQDWMMKAFTHSFAVSKSTACSTMLAWILLYGKPIITAATHSLNERLRSRGGNYSGITGELYMLRDGGLTEWHLAIYRT